MNKRIGCWPYAKGTFISGLAAASMLAYVQADASESEATASTVPASDNLLEEVLVTSRKRTEHQRDVPLSMNVVGGDALVAAKVIQLPDLASSVPGLRVAFATTSPFTFIRGFGSGSLLSFDQSVGKFIDNVSFGRDQDARLPLFDLERVEVLKGPQVLVFGNSATAGALNIVTKKPGNSFEADASVANEFENEEVVFRGGVTMPISSSTSLRLAGFYQDLSKGWMRNLLTQRNEPMINSYAGRGTLRVVPASNLEILLKAEYGDMSTKGDAIQPIRQPSNPLGQFPEVDRDLNRSTNLNVAPFFQDEFSRVTSPTFQGDINYDVFGGTLTSTSAYRELRSAVSVPSDSDKPLNSALISQRYDQFSQEVRFSGTSGALDSTLGAYYEHSNLRSFTVQQFNFGLIGLPPAQGGIPFGRLDLYDVRADTWSIFADLTYHLTDALSISAGARYSDTEKTAAQSVDPIDIVPGLDFKSTRADAIAAINPALTNALLTVARAVPHSFTDLKLDEDHLQPQVVVQYGFMPEQMIYAKYVKGDKAGGFDFSHGLATPPEPFRSEGAEAYELGIKGLILDRTLDYALTVFRETFTDLQVSLYQSPVFVVSNAGKARGQGVELELTWAPVDGLQIGMNGAYLDAEYVSFPNATCTVAQGLATPPGVACVQDRSGTPTQFSSKWTGSLSAEYVHAIGNGRYELGGGVLVFARSAYNAGRENDPIVADDGYTQIDAHIDLRPVDERWSLSLFGKNLSDVNYIEYGTRSPGLSGGASISVSRGLQFGIMLGTKF